MVARQTSIGTGLADCLVVMPYSRLVRETVADTLSISQHCVSIAGSASGLRTTVEARSITLQTDSAVGVHEVPASTGKETNRPPT